ncbi:MAG: hypothetical protein K0R84_1459 [Clostridia bacterium]|jgi:hypothetical protein|nr:hypothetical protein [Clostridia bacterium]
MIRIKYEQDGFVSEMLYQDMPGEDYAKYNLAVESIPQPDNVSGKQALPYVNLETKEVYYKYVDTIPTTQEEIAQLKQQVQDLNLAMAALMGGAV